MNGQEAQNNSAPKAAKRKREPLEVLVQDRWTKQWVHAEYRGEVNRKRAEPRYKVYSPLFASLDRYFEAKPEDLARAHRWVPRIHIRGLAPDPMEVEEFLKTTAYEDLVKLGYVEVSPSEDGSYPKLA